MKNEILHILFVSYDKFPPFRVDVSVLFGKYLLGRGHVIDWLLQSCKPLDRKIEIQSFGGKVFVGPNYSNTSLSKKFKSHLASIFHDFSIFFILKSKKHHILLLKDKFITGLIAIPAAKLFNIKFVYWLSFPYPEEYEFRAKQKTVKFPFLYRIKGLFLRLLLYNFILLFCDHIFVQTERMKKNIERKGILADKMTAVPMGVSIKDIPYYGYELENTFHRNSPIVVYLGSLEKIRRIDFLLRSFEMVLKKEKNAKLHLVGGSHNILDEDMLFFEAKKLGIDHAVTITGHLPQKKAWEHVKNANVCVSPIYPSPIFDVGSPTKLLEYMAMGKASVANDHPEQSKVLYESGAGICVPYCENFFSEAILYLIKHTDIAKKMGIKGRNYIKKYRNYSNISITVEQKLLSIAKLDVN